MGLISTHNRKEYFPLEKINVLRGSCSASHLLCAHAFDIIMIRALCSFPLVNPRRACARVTVVVLCVCVCLCVCLSVYLSVTALAASASVYTSKQRYPRVSLRLYLDFERRGFSKNPSVQELWREKANMQMSWSSPRALGGSGSHNEWHVSTPACYLLLLLARVRLGELYTSGRLRVNAYK